MQKCLFQSMRRRFIPSFVLPLDSFSRHGSQKLFSFPAAGHAIPTYLVLVAGPIEFFGGFLVMVGLLTRWAALICSGEMAYAYWFVHGTHALLPIINGGELAIIYCFLFLLISTEASGQFSIDHISKRKFSIRFEAHSI